MNKKIRLLVVSPIPFDACSSWRCLGPISRMVDIEVVLPGPNAGWVEINSCDMVMMHRPFSPQHVQFMAMCAMYNKKLWVDYDDDLLNVMDDNPTYFNYSRGEVKDSVKKCLQLADIVSVTTEDLKNLYSPYSKEIRIIPNGWDDRFISERDKPNMSNSVLWRGSDSHQRDLLTHSQAIVNAYNETKLNNKWHFIGYRPWFILQHMQDAVFHPGRDFKLFYDVLGDLNPDVVHVPLFDFVFNRCKSNIAAMEGSMSGAVIVGPDWTEWQIPGLLNYKGPEDYQEVLLKAINLSKEEKLERRKATVDFFKNERHIDKMNELRMKIIKDLLGI